MLVSRNSNQEALNRRGAEMGNEPEEHRKRWSNFLSYGGYVFSEELLTPNSGFIISPDGKKICVIDDSKSDTPLEHYDEKQQFGRFDLQFLRQRSPMGFNYSSLSCPACEKPYTVSFKDRLPDDILSINDVIYMNRDRRIFDCTCGVAFAFYDRYEYVTLPFNNKELEPLYQMGMPRTADLLLRYVLSSDSRSLVEDIGAISHMPNQTSLTDNPLRIFNWAIPPCFTSECDGEHEGIYDVRIWRRRVYVLECNRFAETTWHHFGHWGRVVIRCHRFMGGDNILSVFTPPDEILNSAEMLELILRGSKLPSRGRGGRRNVKAADLSEPVRKALGRRYAELRNSLTNVKKDAKAAFEFAGESGWREHILKKYPIFNIYPNLLDAIDPYGLPDNSDGSGGMAPWEVAMQIAAREVIIDYESIPLKKRPSADALKKVAIIPEGQD
jgi:hypothetical protein